MKLKLINRPKHGPEHLTSRLELLSNPSATKLSFGLVGFESAPGEAFLQATQVVIEVTDEGNVRQTTHKHKHTHVYFTFLLSCPSIDLVRSIRHLDVGQFLY